MNRKQLLTVACLASVGYLGLALLTSHSGVFPFEEHARSALSLTHQPSLDALMRGASFLGEEWGLIPLILLGSAVVWRRNRRWASALPAIMIGTCALQWGAKWMTGRPRPNLAPLGFPSGHVLSLVVLFGLAAYVLCRVRSDRAARALGICAGSTLLVVVAASRLYLEAHWVLDVAGGFLLGLAYLMLLIWMVETREAREPAAVAAPVVPSL